MPASATLSMSGSVFLKTGLWINKPGRPRRCHIQTRFPNHAGAPTNSQRVVSLWRPRGKILKAGPPRATDSSPRYTLRYSPQDRQRARGTGRRRLNRVCPTRPQLRIGHAASVLARNVPETTAAAMPQRPSTVCGRQVLQKVEPTGLEPVTFWLPARRSPS